MGEANAAQLSSREPIAGSPSKGGFPTPQADWKGWGPSEQHRWGAEGSADGLGSDQTALNAHMCLVATEDAALSPASGSQVRWERDAASGNSKCFMYNCRYQKEENKKEGTKQCFPGVSVPCTLRGLPCRLCSAVSGAEG